MEQNFNKPQAEQNPIGDAFNIMVSIPDKLEIKMVNASILSDYEVWVFLSSLLSNGAIGFWVSYATNTNNNASGILFWNSVLFTVLFFVALFVALRKRYQLNKKSKDIKLKTSSVENSSS